MVYAADNGHIKISFAQAVDGLVHRRQRGGARGVYGKVGTVHVKHVGQAPGDDIGQFSRHGIFGNGGKFLAHAFVHFVHQLLLGIGRKGFVSRGIF